jgi:hypothetical protein
MGLDNSVYLRQYWENKGILTDMNSQPFNEEFLALRFLILKIGEYCIGNLVLVRPDSPNVNHQWAWKTKNLGFFMHEFQGNMKIFFKATYYDQWVETHESTMPLVHEITGMQILNTEAGQISIRPMEQLMYQFMAMPIPQSQGQYMVAYEFEDIVPQKHLLEAGEPGCSPRYPKVRDIMLVKGPQWQLVCDFQYGVVRHVQTKDAS